MLLSLLQIVGSLGLFLFGMRIMSEGIQKAAGDRMQKILTFMTGNRFAAIATGFFITSMVQSSSATTVMVVGFVNAQLLTLTQAIGVILGANIGTTLTGWLVAMFGFKVNVAADVATSGTMPVVISVALGIGALLLFIKKFNKYHWGEALIGFGLLFLGLMFLKDAIPNIDQYQGALEFLKHLTGKPYSLPLFIAIGAVITFLLQSSSAAMAITLTMAFSGWIDYPTSAAIILGENIGTTTTASLASIGTDVSARRAALAHLLFNVIGVLWMIAVFHPFLRAVDWILPGQLFIEGGENMKLLPSRLAGFHTMFNVCNTMLFVMFVPVFSRFVERLIKDKKTADKREYSLSYLIPYVSRNPELHMLHIKDEVVRMAELTVEMYREVLKLVEGTANADEHKIDMFREMENLTDQMEEEISAVLAAASGDSLNYSGVVQVNVMMRIINELERVADSCLSIAFLYERKVEKEMVFSDEAQQDLSQYAQQLIVFLNYVNQNLMQRLEGAELERAFELERGVDLGRNQLKKQAQRRLKKKTSAIKTELLYIDIVNHMEHIGDFSLTIARSQRELPKKTSFARPPTGKTGATLKPNRTFNYFHGRQKDSTVAPHARHKPDANVAFSFAPKEAPEFDLLPPQSIASPALETVPMPDSEPTETTPTTFEHPQDDGQFDTDSE